MKTLSIILLALAAFLLPSQIFAGSRLVVQNTGLGGRAIIVQNDFAADFLFVPGSSASMTIVNNGAQQRFIQQQQFQFQQQQFLSQQQQFLSQQPVIVQQPLVIQQRPLVVIQQRRGFFGGRVFGRRFR